jgi:hypothetical protein
MSSPAERIEERIYDAFYARNPDGDARSNGLWRAVLDAKKSDDVVGCLHEIFEEVESDIFY